ncbi:rRNA pseudouridine synthase [Patescibacteria group bacterium]|nr:rRNA pseudouridine synthase [Patescibacteria group bacterium]MBU1703074.1 rRNA pseudouridine synthase [Patescibacteria group bacterium]MBU1954221.1 rRNA pseudouridine synthase [Patescibacteria group bacterium]
MPKTRINKFLAQAGICSRRQADKLIANGEVTINGKKAELGATVSGEDKVKVNGKLIRQIAEKIYIAFHKPYGVITTTNPENNNNIMEYIDLPTRIYPIGRLDVQSSGLILLTNDGEIVNKLLKSENKQEKQYLITVDKPLTKADIEKLQNGIMLDDRKTLPAKVKLISSHQFSITIIQGMNRQIRRMCEALGYNIKILKRVRFSGIELGDLPRGKWRHLTAEEIKSLY